MPSKRTKRRLLKLTAALAAGAAYVHTWRHHQASLVRPETLARGIPVYAYEKPHQLSPLELENMPVTYL